MPTVVLGDWNDTTPAAPVGYDLAHLAVDRSVSPPKFSVAVPRATAETYGTVLATAATTPKASVSIWIPSKYTNGQVIAVLYFDKAVKFFANLPGAISRLFIANTGASTFTLKKNADTIGSIAFSVGNAVPTITFAVDVTFAIGDYLQIVAPAVADATAAGFGFTYTGDQV